MDTSGCDMKNWTPVDHIVLIMVITVAILVLFSALILPLLINFYFDGEKLILMRSETVKLIFGVVTSFVSIISMYIGAKIQKRKDENGG